MGTWKDDEYNKPGRIPYRIFWTWDHSTNWTLNAPGSQNSGVANAYTKEPEVFLIDYKRAVDWCAANGMNAIGIVGLLRQRHGGIDSVRRLCEYACNKGIRIYMIAGLYAYGGIYYEGDHPYSLNRFFEAHPECIGKRKDQSPLIVDYQGRWGFKADPQGCPSRKILKDFVLESLDWLFREIPELGGIQMEAGDSGVCHCPLCRERRGIYESDEAMNFADMADIYPQAANVIWNRNPDAWGICETYHHFLDDAIQQFFREDNHTDELKRLVQMPEKTFWQWKCDVRLANGQWTGNDRLPLQMQKFRHVMRAHSGTQWRGGRFTLAIDKIRRQCLLSYQSGFQCVSMFGEGSPFHTNAEFNYLALQYFSDHPFASNDDFARDVMAPCLGNEDLAHLYMNYADLVTAPRSIPAAALDIARIASSTQDYDIARRWLYLGSFINSYFWESSQMEHPKSLNQC